MMCHAIDNPATCKIHTLNPFLHAKNKRAAETIINYMQRLMAKM
jgi:hypothetical protein